MDCSLQIQLWCLGKGMMIPESMLTYRMTKRVATVSMEDLGKILMVGSRWGKS